MFELLDHNTRFNDILDEVSVLGFRRHVWKALLQGIQFHCIIQIYVIDVFSYKLSIVLVAPRTFVIYVKGGQNSNVVIN